MTIPGTSADASRKRALPRSRLLSEEHQRAAQNALIIGETVTVQELGKKLMQQADAALEAL